MKNSNKGFKLSAVIACLAVMFCIGIVYMWSVFQQPVIDHYGWSASAVSLISSAMIMMFVIGIFFGGIILDRKSPRLAIIIGGVLFFAGLFLTSMLSTATSWLIYISYGVLAGSGVGFAYSGAVNCVQKWLPKRRGFAAGISVCAFGLSVVVFSPIAEKLLADYGVPQTFRLLAIVFGVIILISAIFIKAPSAEYIASLNLPIAETTKKQYTIGEAVKHPKFWYMCSALFFLPAAYMIIIPLVKTLAAARGVPPAQASITVQLVGVASALSRLVLPTMSDKTGRARTIFFMTIVTAVAALVMIFARGILYSVAVFAIVFAYSGPAGIYPAMSSDAFGTKNMGSIFGLAFLCIGFSSLLFTWLASVLSAGGAATGNYTLSFAVAAVVCLIPMVCMLLHDRKKGNRDA